MRMIKIMLKTFQFRIHKYYIYS